MASLVVCDDGSACQPLMVLVVDIKVMDDKVGRCQSALTIPGSTPLATVPCAEMPSLLGRVPPPILLR